MSRMPDHISDGPDFEEEIPVEKDEDQAYEELKSTLVDIASVDERDYKPESGFGNQAGEGIYESNARQNTFMHKHQDEGLAGPELGDIGHIMECSACSEIELECHGDYYECNECHHYEQA